MKKKFVGSLETPMEPRLPSGLLESTAKYEKRVAVWVKEDHDKLLLLCGHYEIADGPHMFYQLSLALAREFVPGFQERKSLGRKVKWNFVIGGILVVEIERLIQPGKFGFGVTKAAKDLAKKDPWKSFLEVRESHETSPDPAEALRVAYTKFKSHSFTKFSRDAFKWNEVNGTISEWKEFVAETVKKPAID